MRCLFKFIFAGGAALILFVYFSLYFITPGFMVKRSIQEYLDSKFDRRFTIVSIANNYSPDFLHQVTGYKLTLKDQNGTEITPVFFQKNHHTGRWTSYMGCDIEAQYASALKKQQL